MSGYETQAVISLGLILLFALLWGKFVHLPKKKLEAENISKHGYPPEHLK